ncbi:hypothetical protein Saro_0658 [Novosphingobium aromaticivorans DSM 12444]|uniref:Uncharacterized protein n=1 Tax=Novosphingobium aromaticivorans (strain ATCC 700278 / DSM 12444 / CCUG 56034 / CIP 105152 / NBRC 16084 / F199) TaxID=279238 RepID=Q2GAL8_NOVAD|nr:hypothetical protein [Novosphingobium aromaticivorans]ABD25105.1 hypothetical protein Saro_0658 [Novosphingobium aromaticivorans DSM 12444]SCY95776.1 hypothetical protein SAMN05660666_03878 [Novosphingobium aromaticivorans]
MAFDITRRRALETATIDLKNGDDSPLTDDDGKVLSVTVHGPGSKVWRQASAEINRRKAERLQKAGGKLAASLDSAKEDQVEFLSRVTISFNGWEYPGTGNDREMFAAAYADDSLGFIRDHVHAEVHSWEAFTKGSAAS